MPGFAVHIAGTLTHIARQFRASDRRRPTRPDFPCGGFAVPAAFSLWTILFFNYIQHVHTDPWSEHNRSRSFVGSLMNFLLLNNGYHAVHHEQPAAHGSTLPALHAAIARKVDPSLAVSNFGAWLAKTHLIAPFAPAFGTHQVGRAPCDVGGTTHPDTIAGGVKPVEAGTNAARG